MADPLSIIGTIIQLLDTAKKCYDKVQGARKLKQSFHNIYTQIDLVKATFEEIKKCYRDNDDRRKIADVLEKCEQDTKRLLEIYVLVSENADKPWATRYADYVKSMVQDRKEKVEELWARILEGIRVLQGFHAFSSLATNVQVEQVIQKIETAKPGTRCFLVHAHSESTSLFPAWSESDATARTCPSAYSVETHMSSSVSDLTIR